MTRHIPWIAAIGLVAVGSRLAAQGETAIVGPIEDGTPAPAVEPPPQPDFVVRSTVTRSLLVEEAPEMAGLPAVKGRISVTLNRVDDPKLPDPSPPALAAAPNESVAQEEVAELEENQIQLVFVSATVYDHSRTLVKWYPEGQPGVVMSAWSNIDFNHFSGFASFKVSERSGEVTNYGLMMAVSDEATAPQDEPALQAIADGPAFVLVEGDANNQAAMRVIEGMHELYRVEGARMAQAYTDRTRAQEERRAFLLAHPPQPKNVTIHFWKREQTNKTQGGTGE